MNFTYSFENLATLLKEKLSTLSTNKSLDSVVNEVKQASLDAKNGNTQDLQALFGKYFGDSTNQSNPWYTQ